MARRLAVEPETCGPGDQRRREEEQGNGGQDAGRKQRDKDRYAQVHDRRRQGDSRRLGATALLASEPLRERLGDGR